MLPNEGISTEGLPEAVIAVQEKHSSADLRDLMTPGGIYAQEVAHMFAANRRLWGQSQGAHLREAQRPPLSRMDSPMPRPRGVDTPGSTATSRGLEAASSDSQGQASGQSTHRQTASQNVPESTGVALLSTKADSMPEGCWEEPGQQIIPLR